MSLLCEERRETLIRIAQDSEEQVARRIEALELLKELEDLFLHQFGVTAKLE